MYADGLLKQIDEQENRKLGSLPRMDGKFLPILKFWWGSSNGLYVLPLQSALTLLYFHIGRRAYLNTFSSEYLFIGIL